MTLEKSLSEFDSQLSRRMDRGYIEKRFLRLWERYGEFQASVKEFDTAPGFEKGCDVCIGSRTLWMCLYWCLQSFDDGVTDQVLETLQTAFEDSNRVVQKTPTGSGFVHSSVDEQKKIIVEMEESTSLRRDSVVALRSDRDMTLEEFTEIATNAPVAV